MIRLNRSFFEWQKLPVSVAMFLLVDVYVAVVLLSLLTSCNTTVDG